MYRPLHGQKNGVPSTCLAGLSIGGTGFAKLLSGPVGTVAAWFHEHGNA
ncbi:MAG: hypothetical protein H5U13_04400 [Parvibaculum sp.]|nr:hypothetical protein [Parvibaculum sp.]